MTRRRTDGVAMTMLLLVIGLGPALEAQGPEPENAKTWLGREAEIEAYLKEAEILGLDDLPVGVTNPKAADLAPGGPVGRFAWKPIRPGIQRGFYESYKAEVAAYELDKLLGLGMVPVTVERRIRGELGAAIMWVTPTESFRDLGGVPTPPNRHLGYWTIQLIRAKMFDNLIYNQDPNEGNWLVDPAWNLMVIDHSRSFTPDRKMAHDNMTRVDRYLWERMQQLDEPTLSAALGEWLSGREIEAILERRDLMAELIDARVERDGAATVLMRYGIPSESPPATPAAPAGADLINSVRAALNEAPMIAPSSELTWIGTVVSLAAYDGRYSRVAEAGMRDGHTLGLLAGDEGLICLVAFDGDARPFERLGSLVGRDVEIFGVLSADTEMPLVEVTVSRIP